MHKLSPLFPFLTQLPPPAGFIMPPVGVSVGAQTLRNDMGLFQRVCLMEHD